MASLDASRRPRPSGLAVLSLFAGCIPCAFLVFGVLVPLGQASPNIVRLPVFWAVAVPVTFVLRFSPLLPLWVVLALVAIAAGHGARGVIRRSEKIGVVPATVGLSLGYASLAFTLLAFVTTWILVTFTRFAE